MKLTFNFSNLVAFARKHVSLLLGLCLIVVILLEALVIKKSANFVLRVKNQVPNVQTRLVRVNLQQYYQVEKRIEENNQFESTNVPAIDPFGLAPTKLN